MTGGLSAAQRQTIKTILANFANDITRVDIFGSRAEGAHRPNSDLDLVLHGALDEAVIDRLWTLFHESNLPFSVDVKSHALTRYAPIKAHMDKTGITLFTREELIRDKTRTAANLKGLRYGE